MSKKMKFKPVVTRIKLNPEQAVLACLCYGGGSYWRSTRRRATPATTCTYNSRTRPPTTYSLLQSGTLTKS
jgi:hypothetical protein